MDMFFGGPPFILLQVISILWHMNSRKHEYAELIRKHIQFFILIHLPVFFPSAK